MGGLIRGNLKIRIITYARARQAIDFAVIGSVTNSLFDVQCSGRRKRLINFIVRRR
jgi:hypothetical protein